MAYKITVENNALRIALTGRLTALDLAGLADEAKHYEHNADAVPHRITDMTGIDEVEIHYPEVAAFADKRRKLRFPNLVKSAIIANNACHLAYARMFQTLNDNPQIAIRIFPDEPSASDWVACSGDFGRI